MKSVILILFLMSFQLIAAMPGGCNKSTGSSSPSHLQSASKKTSPPIIIYTYKIISTTDNTYGYNILDRKHLLIHQPSIPGLPSNRGFQSKSDAQKVASFVIKKLENNIMPPGVSGHELKQMNIKF